MSVGGAVKVGAGVQVGGSVGNVLMVRVSITAVGARGSTVRAQLVSASVMLTISTAAHGPVFVRFTITVYLAIPIKKAKNQPIGSPSLMIPAKNGLLCPILGSNQ